MLHRNVLEQMDPRVLGSRLAEARKARGMTQQGAAERIGLARTTLVAVERGQRRVQAREAADLALLYGVPLSELLLQEPLRQFAPQLRAAAGADASSADLAPAIAEFRALCQDYVDLEALCKAPLETRYPEPFDRHRLDPEEAAEDLASAERNRLGLGDGAVLELRQVLEGDVGIRIFILPLPPKVSAMYEFDPRAGGCIALNRSHPPENRRWAAAHNYAHFLADRYQPEVTIESRGKRVPDDERFADAFARHFLMPAAGLRRRFHAVAPSTSVAVSDILLLANRYGVSAEAMTRRLEELRLVPEGVWGRLQAGRLMTPDAQAGVVTQVDHDGLPPRYSTAILPLRYRYLAARAYEEELISEGILAHLLRTDRVDARATIHALRAPDGVPAEGPLPTGFDLGEKVAR